jgi:predicted Zn-dependent protease
VAKFFGRFPAQGMASWVSTHPAPEDRVETVREQVSKSSTLNALAVDSLNSNFQTRFEAGTAIFKK